LAVDARRFDLQGRGARATIRGISDPAAIEPARDTRTPDYPSPDVRSSRLKAARRSRQAARSRSAWRTIHGSTRLLSSMRIGAVRAVRELDARAVPVVGEPVRLEGNRDVDHDGGREDPVEVGRVQPIDDVGDPGRPAALDPGEQVDHPEGREGIVRFGDDRRREVHVRQAGGRRPQGTEAG